jgi:two-component system sensor histidine kinase/response regulator
LAVFSHIGSAPASDEQHAGRIAPSSGKWSQGVRFEALANLAHELRAPIQVLLGYFDILREDLADEIGPRARHVFDRLNVNAHDLARTAENMLDFAYSCANAESELDEDIEIRDLVGEIAPALDAISFGRSLVVDFDLRQAPVRVRCRRKPLRSILSNLAANAIKFTGRGSVKISIRALPSPDESQELEIEVSDTGPGIDPKRLEDAFAAGKQLSGASTRNYRGMGLGLAVVRRNLDALGATLEVETGKERGSRFSVRVPLRPRIVVNCGGAGAGQSDWDCSQR